MVLLNDEGGDDDEDDSGIPTWAVMEHVVHGCVAEGVKAMLRASSCPRQKQNPVSLQVSLGSQKRFSVKPKGWGGEKSKESTEKVRWC